MSAAGTLRVTIVLVMITACTTASVAEDLPATIVPSEPHGAAELQAAVSKALDRTAVTLADDALTRDSVLIIEPARLRDSQGRQDRAQGRETRMPERFRLVTSGQRCALIHERTGQRIELVHAKCAAKR
jgi:hypothetical protein